MIFIAGTFLSFSLPPKVDSAKGEDKALLAADAEHLHGPHLHSRSSARACGRSVPPSPTPSAPTRRCAALSGFLTFFLAFLLREHPLTGQSAAVSLGMVAVVGGRGQRARYGGRGVAEGTRRRR